MDIPNYVTQEIKQVTTMGAHILWSCSWCCSKLEWRENPRPRFHVFLCFLFQRWTPLWSKLGHSGLYHTHWSMTRWCVQNNLTYLDLSAKPTNTTGPDYVWRHQTAQLWSPYFICFRSKTAHSPPKPTLCFSQKRRGPSQNQVAAVVRVVPKHAKPAWR